MKTLTLWSAVLALGFTLAVGDAEAARRLGGGKSTGMQREMTVPQKSVAPAAPAQNPAAAPMANPAQPGMAAAANQAQPKRSWLGPVAGLAAGLGLAALASHFGFGEELASLLMIGLLIMVVLAVVGFIMRKRSAAQQPALAGTHGMQYAGNDYGREAGSRYAPQYPAAGAASAGPAGNIPAGFDAEAFVRTAKVNFLRLQAANDAGNLEDIREFTSPEMFAEIKLSLAERGQEKQETDVVELNAEVLDVAEEDARYVASVRFSGLIREAKEAAPEPFDEIWHLTKPRDGSRGWVLSGIQQVQ